MRGAARAGLVVLLQVRARLDAHLRSARRRFFLAEWDLSTYHHHVLRDLEAEVSWKAAFEAFAESYHFPYVHANSIIGMNTSWDIGVHEAFGLHHRICFPYPWIRLHDDPTAEASEAPVDNRRRHLLGCSRVLAMAFSLIGALFFIGPPGGNFAPAAKLRHSWLAS